MSNSHRTSIETVCRNERPLVAKHAGNLLKHSDGDATKPGPKELLSDRVINSQPSRDEFLTAIYRDKSPSEKVSLGCRKPGTKYWGYGEWKPGAEPATQICYVSPVTVSKPDRARHLSAKAKFRQNCHMIVLDDISTKVPVSAIKLAPSYILETSPGNFQYGYLLKNPLPVKEADAIISGLIDSNLTDKGRTNLSAHVMRVPGSLNDKYDAPFYARMIAWEPTRRFSGEDICAGLGATPRDVDYDNMLRGVNPLADGAVDPIFEWLQQQGRILGGANTAGWYPTTCPWEDEHTTGSLGVDYKPGSPGAFKCLHSHGAEKSTRAFADWVAAQFPGARDILKNTVERARKAIAGDTTTEKAQPPPFYIDMSKSKLFADPTGEAKEKYYEAVFEKRDQKKQATEFLETDLVHVNSEGAYYSFSVGGFVQYRSLDATFAPIINTTGLLDYVDKRGDEKRLSMQKWLAHNKNVVSVASAVSRPGEGHFIGDAVNIAKPFPVHEIPEEVIRESIGAISPFMGILDHVIGNKDQVDHVLDFFACVTSSVEKPGHAVVISSEVHGVGKNLISGTIGMIVGPDYSTTVSQTVLQSAFNPYDNKRWVVLNETRTTSRGSATLHDIEGKMKVSLSNDGEDITINDKNSKHYSAKNISCWYCTSNETVPFQVDKDDRRFYIIKSDAKILPSERAIAFLDWRKNGGLKLLAGYLRLRWEAMDAKARARVMGPAPMTDAKKELIELGDNSLAGAIRRAVSGDCPVYWPEVMAFDDMMLSVRDVFGRFGIYSPAAISSFNEKKLLIALREFGAKLLGRVTLEEHGIRKSIWLLSREPTRFRYWEGLNPAALRRRWLLIKDSRPGETIERLVKTHGDAVMNRESAKVFKIHFPPKTDADLKANKGAKEPKKPPRKPARGDAKTQ